MTKRIRVRSSLKAMWVLAVGLVIGPARPQSAIAQTAQPAQSSPDAASPPEGSVVAKAKSLFAQGSSLYLAGHHAEALDALRSSYTLVPSPNSQLVIARCLRELGRLVEAQDAFASAETEAKRRAAEGAAKYEQTADSAATEGAAVRSGLGTLRIQVEGVDPGTNLVVDGVATAIPKEGTLVVWHTAGDVTVSVPSPSGLVQKQVANVRAGAEITMQFTRPAVPVPPEPVQPLPIADVSRPVRIEWAERRRPSAPTWATPAAVGAGVLTLAGAGMFTAFSIAARQTYDGLKLQCGGPGGCSLLDSAAVARADTGKSQQTIAYTSLVIGAVSAAATATFAVVALSRPGAPAGAGRPSRWRVVVGGTTLGVAAEFR